MKENASLYYVSELRQRLSSEPTIGFAPTLGNLYEGHLDLVSIAQQHAKYRA